MLNMTRRKFITLLSGAAAAWPLGAQGQQAERPRRISVLNVLAGTDPESRPRIVAFEAALRELGWAIGRNLQIDYYWDASDVARTRAVAMEVAETKPDLVVTVATPATQAVRDQAGRVPIVFVQVLDPLGTGLVASLARPGGNITGFSNFEFSMGGKWLELLKDVAPSITRIAVLFNPATTPGAGTFYLQSIEAAAPRLAVKSSAAPVRSVGDIEDALSKLAREPNTGVIFPPDIFTSSNRNLIISLAARNRLPAIYPYRYFATVGGLFSYGSDTTDVFRQAASYVDRILRGEKAGDLPVQQPTKFELVINLKTAKALGLTVPDKLLALADEVIE
jgi:putative ABC transport system substrate-binding protein